MKCEGYCLYTNVVDKDNDLFLPKSMMNIYQVSIYFEHDHYIGMTESIIEDNKGIFIKFEIFSSYEYLVENYKHLSIGFVVYKARKVNNARHISEFKLVEISVVKHPVQTQTYFSVVK